MRESLQIGVSGGRATASRIVLAECRRAGTGSAGRLNRRGVFG